MEAPDLLPDELRRIRKGTLRDLHNELPVGDPVPVRSAPDGLTHVAVAEVIPADVEGDRDPTKALLLSLSCLPADLLQEVLVEKADEVVLLQHRDELRGGEHPPLRVLPAGEALKAAERSRRHIDEGLVVHPDPVLLQSHLIGSQHIGLLLIRLPYPVVKAVPGHSRVLPDPPAGKPCAVAGGGDLLPGWRPLRDGVADAGLELQDAPRCVL